jgi:hypothetical protein
MTCTFANGWPSGYTRGMLLTPAPSLLYVIGVPAGLMVVVGGMIIGIWVLLGRMHRG